MLREIGSIRQDGSRGSRRWFQDDYFDLYLWLDGQAQPLAFQLCYERNRKEGAITWNPDAGFTHDRVDTGDASHKHGMTPILRADGAPPYYRIYPHFLSVSGELPEDLRTFMIERLRAYRQALFGAPRKPRRPRPHRGSAR